MTDMPKIPIFYKMSGSGNDFILIDNRDGAIRADKIKDFVAAVCRRKFSVGADGLILIESSEKADFKWRFFNQDGSLAEMCGNGGRCAARFAYLNQICGPELSFETDAGIIRAIVDGIRVRTKRITTTANNAFNQNFFIISFLYTLCLYFKFLIIIYNLL